MSDSLTLIFEEGYQAFLSGRPIITNPYNHEDDFSNWKHWLDGYKTAEADNSTATD